MAVTLAHTAVSRPQWKDVAGAMHRTDGHARLLTVLLFGFDRERFYMRLDSGRRMVDLLADGLKVSLTFLKPEGVRFVMTSRGGRLTGSFFQRWPATGAALSRNRRFRPPYLEEARGANSACCHCKFLVTRQQGCRPVA